MLSALRKEPPVTLKEIAKIAGVSISTVSRVINNKNYHCSSQETEDKIWELVRKTGYIPNETARLLKSSAATGPRQPVIGFLHTQIVCTFNDRLFSSIAHAAEQTVVDSGFHLGFNTSALRMSPAALQQFLEANRCDGLIVFGKLDERLYSALRSCSKNIVFVGLSDFRVPFDQVFLDGQEATWKALRHLHGLGHRRVCYLGDTSDRIRLSAFKAFSESHFEEASIYGSAGFSTENGYAAASQMIKEGTLPTAVLTSNDFAAIGAIRAFRENHLHVPEDISVVSVGDLEPAQYIVPGLTTVRIPKKELGRLAVSTLSDRIINRRELPVRTELPCEMVLRESSAPPRKNRILQEMRNLL